MNLVHVHTESGAHTHVSGRQHWAPNPFMLPILESGATVQHERNYNLQISLKRLNSSFLQIEIHPTKTQNGRDRALVDRVRIHPHNKMTLSTDMKVTDS